MMAAAGHRSPTLGKSMEAGVGEVNPATTKHVAVVHLEFPLRFTEMSYRLSIDAPVCRPGNGLQESIDTSI
jgi:hypothetical protein